MTFGIDARVTGAEDLVRLAKAAKATGDGQLRKDMLRGIRNAAKPVADGIREQYADEMPKRGGAADWYGGMKISPRTRTTGKSAGVRLQGPRRGRGADAGRVNDSGVIRHPVHGNRDVWADTPVRAGVAGRGADRAAPRARDDMEEVLRDTAARIARSV